MVDFLIVDCVLLLMTLLYGAMEKIREFYKNRKEGKK